MRDLTQDEIDNAPDWANYYKVCFDGYVLFSIRGESIYSKQIPRKEFDISKHKFTGAVEFIGFNGSDIHMEEVGSNSFYTSREDSIAYAKHFKLTADDLK